MNCNIKKQKTQIFLLCFLADKFVSDFDKFVLDFDKFVLDFDKFVLDFDKFVLDFARKRWYKAFSELLQMLQKPFI